MSDAEPKVRYVAYPRAAPPSLTGAAKSLKALGDGYCGLFFSCVLHIVIMVPLICPNEPGSFLALMIGPRWPGNDLITGPPIRTDLVVFVVVFAIYYLPLRKIALGLRWKAAVAAFPALVAAGFTFCQYISATNWKPEMLVEVVFEILIYCFILRRVALNAIEGQGFTLRPSCFNRKKFREAVAERNARDLRATTQYALNQADTVNLSAL